MEEAPGFLARDRLQALLDQLRERGYRCLGPRVEEGVIRYGPINAVAEMPRGMRDAQTPGSYRLSQSGDNRLFAWAAPAQSLRPLVFRPEEPLWRWQRDGQGELSFEALLPEPESLAVIGARACDIAGLYLQDRHFLSHEVTDRHYQIRRRALFVVAVHCTHPAATCFCASTDDGPRAAYGFDLALTELEHGYLVEWRSTAGREIFAALPLRPASEEEVREGEHALAAAAAAQRRRLPAPEALRRLFDRLDDDRWDAVAERCLGCGNCTQVCPSCFCCREEQGTPSGPAEPVQIRLWDSCFDPGHSYIHGLYIRPDIRSRYRQWLTHKLAGWQQQYGRPGCTGCGRCITWCPVGIDLVEEAQVLCVEREGAQTDA